MVKKRINEFLPMCQRLGDHLDLIKRTEGLECYMRDTLKSVTPIIDLLAPYTTIEPSGDFFKAPCCFYKEETTECGGELMINADKNVYYCKECQSGGDAISFIMKENKLSLNETTAKMTIDYINKTKEKKWAM